jgi:hypothetical protein
MQDLFALEEQGWRALSMGGEAAQAFYDALLTDDAVMVFRWCFKRGYIYK